MRTLIGILLACTLTPALGAQPFGSSPCANGRCPLPPSDATSAQPAAKLQVDPRPIARIVNARAAARAVGTGTLVDADGQRGLVVTCAHLFRDGAGTLTVAFPKAQTFTAQLAKIDQAADLAALVIAAPGVDPVAIADAFPARGDPLVSCGYGSDGQLWCNRGVALGYVTTGGGRGAETLELTGGARFGDSGGPVLDRNGRLVAVLFGTNGRVVDGTFCGRVRRFLSDLSPRFRTRQAPSPATQPIPGPVAPGEPLAQDASPPASSPPKSAPAPSAAAGSPRAPATGGGGESLARFEQLVSRINHAWQALGAKIDALAAAAEQARQGATSGPSTGAPPMPGAGAKLPQPGAGKAPQSGVDALEKVAEPWISAKLAALLVSLGVPGGIAGVAAGAVVWLVMRRARQRLQAELNRLKASRAGDAPASQSADAAAPANSVVERHHNQYVPYEVTALDKAWAAAHAHIGEKYPGAVPYLKMVEGVKDQLLSGNNDPQLS